jgi:hypothetical protein
MVTSSSGNAIPFARRYSNEYVVVSQKNGRRQIRRHPFCRRMWHNHITALITHFLLIDI